MSLLTRVVLGLLFATFSIVTVVSLPTLEATNVVVLLLMRLLFMTTRGNAIVDKDGSRKGGGGLGTWALAGGATSCETVI